jgi:hypothetical protein
MTAEWKPMYHPTPEQAEADRRAAYESGVPHGYVAPGDKYRDLPSITLRVISELVSEKWVVGRGLALVVFASVGGQELAAVLCAGPFNMLMQCISACRIAIEASLPPH